MNTLFSQISNIDSIKFEINQTYGPYQVPGVDMWISNKDTWKIENEDKKAIFSVNDGKIVDAFKDGVADINRVMYGDINYLNILNAVNRNAKKMQNNIFDCT